MPTATALAMPARTVLNVLNNSSETNNSVVASGTSANALMGYPGVDLDVIYDLAGYGYLIAPHRWAVTSGLDPTAPGYTEHVRCCVEKWRKQGDRFFNFRTTSIGAAWVRNDPLSVLLRSVWTRPRRQMRLHEALGFSDRDAVAKAFDGGYLTLHYIDGHPTSRCGDYEFRHSHDFYLAGALQVRNVLG